MTYKEFDQWCQDNGYRVSHSDEEVYVIRSAVSIGYVYKWHRNAIGDMNFEEVEDDLFDKMVELAKTPLHKRDETKRYIVKIPAGRPDAFCAVAKDGSNLYMYDDSDPDLTSDYKLTEKQIKKIDERFMAFAEEIKE